jgi:hypothetical protein
MAQKLNKRGRTFYVCHARDSDCHGAVDRPRRLGYLINNYASSERTLNDRGARMERVCISPTDTALRIIYAAYWFKVFCTIL